MIKILGRNDDVTTCECCGKKNLKYTVVLGTEEGEKHFGRDCAAKAVYGSNKSRNVKCIEMIANAKAFARKWLKATPAHTGKEVARAIRVKFTNCNEHGEYGVMFHDGEVIEANEKAATL